jgi:sugar (pentulose or hexulose) kinase
MPKPKQRLLLAIDIGTSYLRAAWFDSLGNNVHISATRRIKLASIDQILASLGKILITVPEQIRSSTKGLAISASSPEMVQINSQFHGVGIISPWQERTEEDNKLISIPLTTLKPFGGRIPPESILSKANQISNWDNITWIADLSDALTGILAHKPIRSRSCAVWSLLLNEHIKFFPKIAKHIPFDIYNPGDVIGVIDPEISRLLSLPNDSLIIAGGVDGMLATIVDTQFQPGRFVLVGGSTHVLQGSGSGDSGTEWYGPLPDPLGIGLDFVASVWESGIVWQQLADYFTEGNLEKLTNYANTFRRYMSNITPMPGWWGNRTSINKSLKGWKNITPQTCIGELIYSIAEGIVLEGKRRIEALRSAHWNITSIVLDGGMATIPWWAILHHEKLAIPVMKTSDPYGSLRGAAACVSVGLKETPNMIEASKLFSNITSNLLLELNKNNL